MLSRTADHLYWMARHTERAENTARMLDVQVQTALLPQSPRAMEQGWRAMLGISELEQAFMRRYPVLTPRDVLDFMTRAPDNPSSIASCLRAARENARAVRDTLTTEVWETLNTTWLELEGQLAEGFGGQDPSRFFEWVKHRSHLSRGVILGTMLKDEAFHFIHLGTFLERADNTARLLDVKFHEAPPQRQLGVAPEAEAQADFYYWAAVLRSMSAFETYRKVYRDAVTPERVADLLILRADMPRSLLTCMNEVMNNLQKVHNKTSADTERSAGKLHAQLQFSRIDDIMEQGLHDFLSRFLERIYDLGNRVSHDFLLPLSVRT